MHKIAFTCLCLLFMSMATTVQATVSEPSSSPAQDLVEDNAPQGKMEKVAEHVKNFAHNRWQQGEKDTTIITRLLTMNTPMLPEFNTNRLFTFVSKNQNYAFRLGALVKASLSVSHGDNDNSESNDPKRLGLYSLGDDTGGNIHISGSNIVFNFVGNPRKGHYVAAFIGMKVAQNDDYHPRLDHAYVRYNYLTVGKTSTTYDDNVASLFIIDGADAVASGSGGNMQISYQPFYKDWRFGVGIEQIRASYTARINDFDGYTPFQAIPDFPFYVSYEPDKSWHVRLAGVLRGLRYADQLYKGDTRKHIAFGWGAKLTGHWDFYPFKGFWQIQTGQGNAAFFSANRDMNLDLVPDKDRPGHMATPTHLGSTIGMQYNWRKNVYSVFRASYLRNWIPRYENGSVNYEDHSKHMMNTNINTLWDVNKLMTCGLEYSYCGRKTNGGTWFDSHELMVMAFISF